MIRNRLKLLIWSGFGLLLAAILLTATGFVVAQRDKERHEETEWLREKLMGLNVVTMDMLYDTSAVVHPHQWQQIQEQLTRRLHSFSQHDKFWPSQLQRLNDRLKQRMERFLNARAACRKEVKRNPENGTRCNTLLDRLATQVRLALQELFVETSLLERQALKARERLYQWGGVIMLVMLTLLASMTLLVLLPTVRRLDAGLGRLVNAARHFAGSDEVVPLPVERDDELGVVTRAFNQMMAHRLAVEDRLRKSEANLAEAQRVAHLGSWELDLVKNHLWWSEEIYRIFEIDPARFGASYEAFLDRVHPEDRDEVNRVYRKSVEERRFYEIVHRLRMDDGRVKYVHERGRTYYDEDGRPLRSIGTVQDITERELAYRALRESERELDAIIENLPAMVFLKDAKTLRIIRFNRAGERMLGIDRNAVIGHTDHELFPKKQADAFVADDRRVLETGHPLDIPKERIETADGLRYLHTRKVCLQDSQGNPRFLLGIAEDITEQVEAENRVRHRLALEALMARISTTLAQADEEGLKDALQHAVAEIGSAFEADRCHLHLLDQAQRSLAKAYHWDARPRSEEEAGEAGLPLSADDFEQIFSMLEPGEILQVRSPEEADTRLPALSAHMQARDIDCLVQVPVLSDGNLLGVLGFETRDSGGKGWPEEDLRLLRIVSESVANALLRVRNLRAIREHTWYLEGLDRISDVLARETRQHPLLEAVVKLVMSLFQADRAWVLKAAEEGREGYEVPIEFTRPEYPGLLASGFRIPDDEFSRRMEEAVLSADKPLAVHFDELPGAPAYYEPYQIRSMMLVAIRPKMGPPWFLGIHQCSHRRHWSEVEKRLFQAIADRVAIALVGVRLLQEIEENERRLREAERIAQVGSWELDLATGRAYWSDQEFRCLGYEPGSCEAGYQAFEQAVHPDDREWVNQAVQEAAKGVVSDYDIQHRVVWPDGSVHVVHELAQVVRNEQGEPVRMIGTTQDISQRVALEQELQRHRQHLEELVAERTRTIRRQAQIIQQTNDAVVTTDLEGRVTSWNRGAQRVFGYNENEVLGRHVGFLYAEEMQGRLYETLLEPLREKGTLEKEVQLQRKEGTLFPAFISLSLLFDEQGEPEGVVGYAVDISELRRREAELKRLAERLEASNRELESFSYSVSHDLRAPLRAIDGFSQALEEDYGDRLDETASDYLRRIRGGAQRLGILIDDLLQLSRVNREALRLERVDLAEMARSVIEELRATEPERQVELILDDDMVVIGDPRLMRAVVANLLGNAWKFTGKEPRGRIEFRRQASGQDVFCVRDNGVGFDMRHAGKLFGAFQRLHRASEFPGTGVGLATVQRIVHRHGGRVWAEAEPGKGARFCFSIGSDLQGTLTQLDQEETG